MTTEELKAALAALNHAGDTLRIDAELPAVAADVHLAAVAVHDAKCAIMRALIAAGRLPKINPGERREIVAALGKHGFVANGEQTEQRLSLTTQAHLPGPVIDVRVDVNATGFHCRVIQYHAGTCTVLHTTGETALESFRAAMVHPGASVFYWSRLIAADF